MSIRIDGTNTTANPGITGADADTGLQFGTDEVSVVTGGTERVKVDSSGQVGIGTSSPVQELHIASSTPAIRLEDTDTNAFAEIETDNNGNVYIKADEANTQASSSVRFSVDATERMRIDSSGNVGIGTTGPGEALQVAGGVHSSSFSNNFSVGPARGFIDYVASLSTARVGVISGGDTSAENLAFFTSASGSTGGVERMRIASNGGLTVPDVYASTSANAANIYVFASGRIVRSTSSEKYKTNVETLQDSYADALLNCRPVWYRSTCEGDNPEHGWWGFIAEEVAEIDPRLVQWKTTEVSYDENGSIVETPCDPEPEGVAYDRFVPHLLNLIKRQQAAIETLEAKVATLEGGAS